jgi:HK97 family phage major capsid protein
MLVKGFDVRRGDVPVTKADVASMVERKALPTIGAGVIQPQRLPDVVRVSELDALDFLALLNTSPMSSPSVEWVRVTSYTRAAAPTAAGTAKPEAALVTDLTSSTAKTIAVWIPVTEQQLQDAQIVINEVDTHLRWDVRKKLEEECLYGPNTGEHFNGLFNDSGVLALTRTKSGDTLIDKVRRAVTDVRVSGFQPNGVALHPYDWEEIVLSKGSDNRYVWVVVTDENGSRLWGLRVSECLGAEETALASAPERNILVGDFQRGTTLYMRDEINVQIGWQADDFIKNKRTIRAELRGVLATRRPLAFRKIKTHTASGAS